MNKNVVKCMCILSSIIVMSTGCKSSEEYEKKELRLKAEANKVDELISSYEEIDSEEVEKEIRGVLSGDFQWLLNNSYEEIPKPIDEGTGEEKEYSFSSVLKYYEGISDLAYYWGMYENKVEYFKPNVAYDKEGNEYKEEKEWLFNDNTKIDIYNTIGGSSTYTIAIANGKLPCIIKIKWEDGKIQEFSTRIAEH